MTRPNLKLSNTKAAHLSVYRTLNLLSILRPRNTWESTGQFWRQFLPAERGGERAGLLSHYVVFCSNVNFDKGI